MIDCSAWGMLAKSVTKPTGTTISWVETPIRYVSGWRTIQWPPSTNGLKSTGSMGCWACTATPMPTATSPADNAQRMVMPASLRSCIKIL